VLGAETAVPNATALTTGETLGEANVCAVGIARAGALVLVAL
jgi:hypothetical protein